MTNEEILKLAHQVWPEEWRYDTNDDFVTCTFEELGRFANAVIKQHEAKLIAGAGEPVCNRVHPFDYGIGHEGVYAVTHMSQQVAAWERKGWNVEPLYTASQVAGAVSKRDTEDAQRVAQQAMKIAALEVKLTGWKDVQKDNIQIQVDQHLRIDTLESTLKVALEALEKAHQVGAWLRVDNAIKQIKEVLK